MSASAGTDDNNDHNDHRNDAVVHSRVSFTFTERPVDWPLDALAAGSSDVTWLRQVHGSTVVYVNHPGDERGSEADAAVTTVVGAKLLIRTADCVPVVLSGTADSGVPVLGVAHAGWHGLLAGVIGAVTSSMQAVGARSISAVVGPCIGVECYEFGAHDLEQMVDRFGPTVIGTTSWETPALNMIECVARALAEHDVEVAPSQRWACTACEPERFYSHRARQESQRLGLVAEIMP